MLTGTSWMLSARLLAVTMISSNGRDVSASLPTVWAIAGVPRSAATDANINRFAVLLEASVRTPPTPIEDFEPASTLDLRHLDRSFRLRLRDIYIPLAIVYELLTIDCCGLLRASLVIKRPFCARSAFSSPRPPTIANSPPALQYDAQSSIGLRIARAYCHLPLIQKIYHQD
jgi:hypothetical protein